MRTVILSLLLVGAANSGIALAVGGISGASPAGAVGSANITASSLDHHPSTASDDAANATVSDAPSQIDRAEEPCSLPTPIAAGSASGGNETTGSRASTSGVGSNRIGAKYN